jgi:hypothetical protein
MGVIGSKHTEETKRKISETHKNEKNPMWKGDKAGVNPIHRWIEKRKQKQKFCEFCHQEKELELASIDGTYKRDINHFLWLCYSCHMKLDLRLGLRKRDNNGKWIKRNINL